MRRVTSAGLSLIAALAAGLVTACNDGPTEVPMPRTTTAPAHIPVSFATASTASGATFTTNKDDYLPGDTLRLAGSGWQSGDSLDIHLEVDPQSHSPLDWAVGIDESGGFRDSSYVVQDIDIGVTFYLTATSRATGESATATFTDGNISIKSNKPGVTFVVAATKYVGSGTCTSGSGVTETNTTPTIDNSGTPPFSANLNPSPESYRFVATATSVQGAAFVNWTTSDAVVTNSGSTLCVAGFTGGGTHTYTANYNANPDLTISKSASGAFAVGASGGTYQITVSNSTGTASARGSAGVTVKDTLPSGLTFSGSSGAGWQACTASGQVVSCDLANGQSVDPGGTKTLNLVVNVATGACPTVTNRAWVIAADEPVGNAGNNGSGNVATSISTGCPSANTPPSVDAGDPYTVAEGTQLSLTPTVTDPDAGDVLSYKWSIAYTTAIDLNGSCTFDDDTKKLAKITCDDDSNGGTFTLTLEVKDGAGGHTVSDNATLTVTNANPTADAGTSYSGNEGSAIQLNGTGDDPGNNDDDQLTYEWSISTTGIIDAGGACSFDDNTKKDAKVTCTDDSNGSTFDLSLVVKDDDNGTSTTNHATLSVANVNPTANAGGSYSGSEGGAIQLNGSGDDVGSNDVDDLTYEWTVNTSGIDAGGTCTFDDGTKKDAKVTCTDDSGAGTFTLSLTVKDDDGGTSTASTASLTVSNVAPTMSITAPGDYSVWAITAPEFGLQGFMTASFSDVGTNDKHGSVAGQGSCSINWGDGDAAGFGVVAELSGAGTCKSAAGNPYTDDGAGIYLITVTITDDDGSSVSASRTIIVYDPSAGFVTGGGWISSPAGAYVADPSLAGRANFGFVSKYLKGNNVPTGNTEFQFQAGNLNFHSETYEWLVVNQNGLNAQFKGNGLINGQGCSADREGKCRFMLWAYDGTKNGGYDTFRIEIWTEDSGGIKHDIYDNGGSGTGGFSTTAINGGSIQVQTGKK